jgi:SAM-dependent methyltransferase
VSELAAASGFLIANFERIREAARRGWVVDFACGRGRHARAVAERGIPVIGIDRDPAALATLRANAGEKSLDITAIRADLETHAHLPLAPGSCAVLLVFNYLHRPSVPELIEALQPRGLLLYETFTIHQRSLGYGPKRKEFLLEERELPQLFTALSVLETWEGTTDTEPAAAVARLVAQKR